MFASMKIMLFTRILNSMTGRNKILRSHIRNLLELAMADGEFVEEESRLIFKIGRQYGISENRILDIQRKHAQVEFKIPRNRIEKFNLLYDLVLMMIIDNDIHTEELKLCQLFAIKFGYPAGKVPHIIDTIRQNIIYGLGYDESMKRVSLLLLEPVHVKENGSYRAIL
jgi:hypothetical protein